MRLYGASLKTRLLLGGFRVGSRAQKGSDNLCVHTAAVNLSQWANYIFACIKINIAVIRKRGYEIGLVY